MRKTGIKLLAAFLTITMLVTFIPIFGIHSSFAEEDTGADGETYEWGFPGISYLDNDWDNNWMSRLPDGAKLNELSIPGAHDAAATYTGDDAFGVFISPFAVTQDHYIWGLLDHGIRYFDLRINKDGDDLAMCHKSIDLYGMDTKRLKLQSVIDDMLRFLRLYGPNETLILQIKCDDDNCDAEIYYYFRSLLEEYPDLIYCGDHVPTLGEVRGKIVILSRLNLIGAAEGESETIAEYSARRQTPFLLEDGTYWALDVSAFRGGDGSTRSMAKTAEFGTTEVWTEDMYNVPKWEKNVYISYSLAEHGDNNYASGCKKAAREKGIDSWSIIYTSMSHQNWVAIAMEVLITGRPFDDDMVWPRDGADYINPVLKEFIGSIPDMYTGCLVGDFYDLELIRRIWSTNFLRRNEDPWNSYYTVQFDSQGGSSVDAQQVLYGEKAVRPEDPVREGYLFDGWFINSTDDTSDPYAFDSTPVNKDIVLYARWKDNAEPTPSDISYQFTGGGGSIWVKGSRSSADFTLKRSEADSETFGRFTGILTDDTEVDASYYTAEAGSLIIRLDPEWLETLSVGSHTLTVIFDDGSASAEFEIKNGSSGTPGSSPYTGVYSNTFVWAGLIFTFALVLIELGIYRKGLERKQ